MAEDEMFQKGFFPSKTNANLTGLEDVCANTNCGEAGCMVDPSDNRQALCLCPNNMQAPDQYLRCNITVHSPVNPDGNVLGPGFVRPFGPEQEIEESNTTAASPDSHPVAAHSPNPTQPPLQILQLVLPLAAALVLLIAIIVAVFAIQRRRRHTIYTRHAAPKHRHNDSPGFLHKHDNVALLESMTVVSKNPTYASHELDDALLAELKDKHICKEQISLLEEIGEGAFGKVFKGDMQVSEDNISPVAVKILKPDATRETRDDFRREVKIMSSFDHVNILKLIGIVPTGEESPFMIFEYMEHGDLTDVLRRNDPCVGSKYHIRMRPTDLIDTSTQISNGMVYLASRHFVHRDLATRNCLVGSELVVKISDFGMSRDIYTCDYYKIGGARMLPVRWMSPESMKYGKFTTESDVWAFGVVLWEIFSFGKQPYYGHANEEVIRFIEDGILLQKPNGCPETLYHIMLGCWRRIPHERFSFQRIHNLLVEYEQKVLKYARHLSSQRTGEVEEV